MLQRSLLGCWQLFYLHCVAVVHNFVKIHKAGHNFYPIKKKKEQKIITLAWLPFIVPFYIEGTVLGRSQVFLSANLTNFLFSFYR